MTVDAEAELATNEFLRYRYEQNDFKLAIGEDPRVTKLGALLRASSLDDLPQIWNVLCGDT